MSARLNRETEWARRTRWLANFQTHPRMRIAAGVHVTEETVVVAVDVGKHEAAPEPELVIPGHEPPERFCNVRHNIVVANDQAAQLARRSSGIGAVPPIEIEPIRV